MIGRLLQVKPLTGRAATEAALKGVHGPSILHLATHGFFHEADREGGRRATGQMAVTPRPAPFGVASGLPEMSLLRSGLALAGANGRQGGAGDDGILTALEISGLDLWGTKLVALSACQTGLGDVLSGEGVYGLRRALGLAGAESQLISLWKVNDEATKEMMVDYYSRLRKGEGRSAALREVQRGANRRSGYAHPYFWAGFILSGGWDSLDEPKPAVGAKPE